MGAVFASPIDAVSPNVPGLYIGHVGAASDADQLRTFGITHIVDVSQVQYELPTGVVRLKLDVPDVPEFDIRRILPLTNAFIRRALSQGGRVLVHCRWGVSRSASVVVGYLMAFGPRTLAAAMQELRAGRWVVQPNRGFQQQLAAYDAELRAYRQQSQMPKPPLSLVFK
jgi:atypical dual specificity phosphatase